MKVAELKIVIRLVISHALQHPARMMLTMFSTIAAACIVVWVVSGYDSLSQKFDEFAEGYLGRYELILLPVADPSQASSFIGGTGGPALSQELIEALRADPAVAAVDPVFQTRARIQKPGVIDTPERDGAPTSGSPRIPSSAEVAASASAAMTRMNRVPSLVGTDASEPPHTLLEGVWLDPRQMDRSEGVLSSGSAEQLGVKVGDEVAVGGGPDKEVQLVKIVGIVEQSRTLPPPKFTIGLPPSREAALRRGPTSNALYVRLTLAEKLTGAAPRISFAGIVLRSGVKPVEFQAAWSDRFNGKDSAAEMQSLAEVENEITNSTTSEAIRIQAYSATGISLLAALFIIFTTLSMGVHERIRQFAVLRAVSLTKAQIGAMIAIESMLLGLVGWGGGLLAGWGLLELMRMLRPNMFPDGVSLGKWCILLSGACALGGALAASIMPAWRATNVSPLEAMAPRQQKYGARFSWGATIVGLLLIAVNPLLVFWVPMADTARYGISAAMGCTSMVIGFVLLAPGAIIVTERFAAPMVARLLGLDRRLLAKQLTMNLSRTLGAVIAPTLGLGLFVAMQTWGYSMLGPFTPGKWAPDMVAGLTPTGVPFSEIENVQHIKGIKTDQCLPLAVEQTKFADDITGFRVRPSATRQDNCVMLGVDTDRALGGKHPMFDFDFVQGTREEALAKIKNGRYCLVPDHFQRESGLNVGDKFSVVPPETPNQKFEYEIAGVVSMSGWHWISKVGLRNRNGGRAAGLMFASFDQVRNDFGIDRTTFFWMNLDGTATEEDIKNSLQAIAERNFDPSLAAARRRDRPERGAMGPPGNPRRGNYSTTINIRTAEGVRTAIRERADGIIWGLSQLPLVTLAVTSLGVMNTILSSVRARRWEMGVMRALGLSRFSLFRLILAEAVLVAIVACVLSVGLGVLAGYCGTGVTRYINIRGGMITPLVIPWAKLLIGFGITLALCVIAALWPAIATGRAEPLRLLQAGRASM
ncbi:MAG TPA: ABC transporter permease [Pirellulales bacterium]|jgi:putative ABC transport system permease protein